MPIAFVLFIVQRMGYTLLEKLNPPFSVVACMRATNRSCTLYRDRQRVSGVGFLSSLAAFFFQ